MSSDFSLEPDSSVKVLSSTEALSGLWKQGELVSEPLEPIIVGPWVRKSYPDKTNESCGLHVHVSVKVASHYGLLTDERFQPTVIEYFRRWAETESLPKSHSLWPRLEGKSEYCQHKWWPGLQMLPTKKDYDHHREGCRYTAINYCYGRNRTMECRILPMLESKELAVRAVRYYMSVVNAALLLLVVKDKSTIESIPVGSPYVESSIERF